MKTTTSGLGMMALGLLALASSAPALAGEPTRSMAALDERVEPGTQVDVVDGQGRILRGDFVRADDEGILVSLQGSSEGRRLPAQDVMTVTRPGDSLKNGALIGAAVGLLAAVAVNVDTQDMPSMCATSGCKVGMTAFSVGLYTGIGVLVDRAIKGREVVYRAPTDRLSWSVTPHPVPRGAGVRLALRF